LIDDEDVGQRVDTRHRQVDAVGGQHRLARGDLNPSQRTQATTDALFASWVCTKARHRPKVHQSGQTGRVKGEIIGRGIGDW